MPGLQQELFSGRGAPDGTVAVNARCLVRTQDGHRVVLVAGIVLCQHSTVDRMAEAHAMACLVEPEFDENPGLRGIHLKDSGRLAAPKPRYPRHTT
jgi:hypothetical protein